MRLCGRDELALEDSIYTNLNVSGCLIRSPRIQGSTCLYLGSQSNYIMDLVSSSSIDHDTHRMGFTRLAILVVI